MKLHWFLLVITGFCYVCEILHYSWLLNNVMTPFQGLWIWLIVSGWYVNLQFVDTHLNVIYFSGDVGGFWEFTINVFQCFHLAFYNQFSCAN